MKRYVRFGYYILAYCISKIILLLPYSFAVKCGGALGLLAYHLVGHSRKIAIDQIRLSLPEKSETEAKSIARQVFVNQGKNLFELFSFPKLDKKRLLSLVTIENSVCFSKALSQGHGVLLASAHCGNWEIMGAALSENGFPINVIARKIYIDGLNRMLVGFRKSKGEKVILRSGQESAKEILRSIRHNEALAILIDQDTAVPGVFVDFFARPAWTPSGLATLALKTGAPVILALDVRQADDTHRVVLSGPFDMARTGDKEQDMFQNTQLITKQIENHIRNYPSQWVWMHERWKTERSDIVDSRQG